MPEEIKNLGNLVSVVTLPRDFDSGTLYMEDAERVKAAFSADFGGLTVEEVIAEPGGQERLFAWANKMRASGEFEAKPSPPHS